MTNRDDNDAGVVSCVSFDCDDVDASYPFDDDDDDDDYEKNVEKGDREKDRRNMNTQSRTNEMPKKKHD